MMIQIMNHHQHHHLIMKVLPLNNQLRNQEHQQQQQQQQRLSILKFINLFKLLMQGHEEPLIIVEVIRCNMYRVVSHPKGCK